MDWSTQNTTTFIDKIHDRVRKRQLQGSTFKIKIWEDMNDELTKIIGENYGVDRLKGKFNHLRLAHHHFSTLLSRTRVTWDSESNKVHAPEKVWEDLFMKGRFYKHFNGSEHDYDILGEIFNSSIATSKLCQASTHEPPTSDEERELEKRFLSNGVHVDSDAIDVDGDDLQELRKKKKATTSLSKHRRKEARNSRLDKLDAALNKWTKSISVRTKLVKAIIEESKARAKRYKAQATSSMHDPYSIDVRVELLEPMEDIPSKIFNYALEKFKDKEWRTIFVKLSTFRKKEFLVSLKSSSI